LPESVPPPPPIQVPPPYHPNSYGGVSRDKKRGAPFAITSVVLAALGVIPLLILAISSFDSYYGGRGIGYFLFVFFGVIIHGIGFILGITGYALGSKGAGLIGMIGNGVIFLLIIILMAMAVAHNA